MSAESRLRDDICRFGRSLFERGLTPGSSGDISVRLDNGGWLATPANAGLGFLDPARLSRLNAYRELVEGDPPTTKLPLHAAFYESRASARAVVRLRSTHAVALTLLPEIDPQNALPPITPDFVMACGCVPILPYFRPGDPAAAEAIRGLGGRRKTVLLAHQGALAAGETLRDAVDVFEELEQTARLYLLVRGLSPRTLNAEQIGDLIQHFDVTDPAQG